jgi:CRP/FNR family cyclic AMP-dependent transcriptional regulator
MYRKGILKKLPIFEHLGDEELELVASVAEKKTYEEGGVIYSEAMGGGTLFIIIKGSVRITKMVRFEEKQTLTKLKKGEFFGEMSFIDGHTHSATAEAIGSTELVEIKRKNFDKLAAKNPELAYKITMSLALQVSRLLRKMDERFVEMVNYMWGKGKI